MDRSVDFGGIGIAIVTKDVLVEMMMGQNGSKRRPRKVSMQVRASSSQEEDAEKIAGYMRGRAEVEQVKSEDVEM